MLSLLYTAVLPSYYLGQQPIVVIKDLGLLKEVMVKQFDNFRDRPPQPGLLRKKADTPRGLVSAEGAYWKKIRTTLSPSFSSSKMKMVGGLSIPGLSPSPKQPCTCKCVFNTQSPVYTH